MGGIESPLCYNTRDAKGNDIVKEVEIKQFDLVQQSFTCMCGADCVEGVPIKRIVSSNFTDWAYVTDFVCARCSGMFSLYFYSYIVDPSGVRLLNVREMAEEIQNIQKPPFKIVVSVSQKKHLFYKATFCESSDRFNVNLEEERIRCDFTSLREQFSFISSLQALGESKQRLKEGNIRYATMKKVGSKAVEYLHSALQTRQVQIPLHLAQKPNITEEEALCNLDLILNR